MDNVAVVHSPAFAAGLHIFAMILIWGIIVGRWMQNYSGSAGGRGTNDSTAPAAIFLNVLVLIWICLRWKTPGFLPIAASILAAIGAFVSLPGTFNGTVFPVPETGFAGFLKLGLLGKPGVVAISVLCGSATLYWQATREAQRNQESPEFPPNE